MSNQDTHVGLAFPLSVFQSRSTPLPIAFFGPGHNAQRVPVAGVVAHSKPMAAGTGVGGGLGHLLAPPPGYPPSPAPPGGALGHNKPPRAPTRATQPHGGTHGGRKVAP